MMIHIVSNSLKMNSGFSNVARHLAIGLRNLDHEITFTGMQTSYIQDWAYGIENLPFTTHYIDELTRYMLNLQKTKPDIVICIFQSDTGDLVQFPLAFKNTFWYSVVEGDVLPFTSSNGYRQVIANGGKIVLPSKHGQKQAKESGIDVHRISYGFDDKIFKPLNISTKNNGEKNKKIRNDDIKYCLYHTEFGKLVSNPIQLCKQGCYNCNLERKEQTKCQYFQEESIVLLSYNKNEKKWIEKRIKISDLPLETVGKFVFGHVKQNLGTRHRMERLLKAYSIFIGQSRQIRDRTILHLHCMPIAANGANLINIIEKLGIDNNVIFSYGDFRASSWSDSAMNILYNTFDCDISASSGEGFGIPTLESMACGIPQIGPRSSSFPELVEESITVDNQKIGPRGILAKIAAWHLVIQDGSYRSLVDEEDLAKCMKLMYNGEDREIYIKNCLEFVKGLTWDNTIKQWDQLIKTVK